MTPARRAELRRYIIRETQAAIHHKRLNTPESYKLFVKARRQTRSFIDTIKEIA